MPADGRPSELAITLVAWRPSAADPSYSAWMYADDIRGRLRLLGFAATTQQVAASLARMARTECPWVERRDDNGVWQYRVTRFGVNDIQNKLPWVVRDAR